MTRIPTAISAAAATVVALATRATGAMTRISAPMAKATVARGLPLMPTVGRGATGLVLALVATPAISAPLVGMRTPATVVLEAIRRV